MINPKPSPNNVLCINSAVFISILLPIRFFSTKLNLESEFSWTLKILSLINMQQITKDIPNTNNDVLMFTDVIPNWRSAFAKFAKYIPTNIIEIGPKR